MQKNSQSLKISQSQLAAQYNPSLEFSFNLENCNKHKARNILTTQVNICKKATLLYQLAGNGKAS